MSQDQHILETCIGEYSWDCDQFVHTLFQCDLDYTNCTPLPISFSTDDTSFLLSLRVDDEKNEISLFLEHFDSDDEIHIFTYGSTPQCFVDYCFLGQ